MQNNPNLEQLHESSYFQVSIDATKQTIHYYFSEKTADMSDEEYVDELKVFIKLVKKHEPKAILGDMRDFAHVISVETQEWVNENLFAIYPEVGMKKIAILLSKELMVQISVELTMEEDSTQSFEVAYFETSEEGLKWIG